MINGDTPEYLRDLVPPTVGENVGRNLRNNEKLRNVRCRTTKYQKSFLPKAVNVWNSLDTNIIKSNTLETFKQKVVSSSKCKELYMCGSRKYSMIHAQMRMNCSNLKAHLHSLHVIDNCTCACGHEIESSMHFFIQL